jgi:hypothetical protein
MPGYAGTAARRTGRVAAPGVLQTNDLSAAAARRLALEVMGLAHGVGTLLMAGQLSLPDAQTLIQNYLARLRPQLSR